MTLETNRVSDFIREIISDANAGRSFVPFIGSGLSSPSGIIMGMEFTNYLAFTMYLVLCDRSSRERTHGEGRVNNWSLELQGWPPAPSDDELSNAREWIREQFKMLCDKYDFSANYDASGNQLLQSVSHMPAKTPLEEILSTLTQPPIPQILRSTNALTSEEEIRQLTQLLIYDDGAPSTGKLTSWLMKARMHSSSSQEQVVEVGLRSLSDWRETLTFLAMVRVEGIESVRLSLGDFEPSIIDDFNSTITRDKRPNLGHKILAHLSEPLRVTTVLTTNFDTLTEEAYAAQHLPLRVLPVSTKGRLPSARTVAATDTLIKLHGESHETRADLSLDEEPNLNDKRTFCQYLTRGTGHLLRRLASQGSRHTKSNSSRLLVIGYSGNDYRCIQMIKHWLEVAPDDPKVYWICFSESDIGRVRRLFKSNAYAGKIRILMSSRPDLVLYELYQSLVLSLPPGGLAYEFSHVLPPKREKDYDHDFDEVRKTLRSIKKSKAANPYAGIKSRLIRDATVLDICEKISLAVNEGKTLPSNQDKEKLSVVYKWTPAYRLKTNATRKEVEDACERLIRPPVIIDAAGGVVRASALAASELSSNKYKKVLWFELQDYVDVDSLLRDLLRSIGLRFGLFQSRHVTTHPMQHGLPKAANGKSLAPKDVSDALEILTSHFRALMKESRVNPESLVVLLCGRDSYGNCSGVLTSPWKEREQFLQLHLLIEVLGQVGVPTVYFPCTKIRQNRKSISISQMTVANPTRPSLVPSDIESEWPSDEVFDEMQGIDHSKFQLQGNASFSVFKGIVSRAFRDLLQCDDQADGNVLFSVPGNVGLEWIRRVEFIYAVTLFRHSRHPNSVCSEGVFPCPFRFRANSIDNDFVRAMEAGTWIEELRKTRVFFSKPGGASWMHRDVRRAIFEVVDRLEIPKLKTSRQHFCFSEMRARLHFWIGDWYYKAFCSSGHLTPIIESVFHWISAAVFSKDALPKRDIKSPTVSDEHWDHRRMIFESSVTQATKALLFSWDWLLLWQASPASVGWLNKHSRDKSRAELEFTIGALNCSQDQESRLRECMDEFLWTLEMLERAVMIEGGGETRETSSGMSRCAATVFLGTSLEGAVARLSAGSSNQSRYAQLTNWERKLDHGAERIRIDAASLDADIEKSFKECGYDAEKLWTTISQIANGDDQQRDNFGKLKAEWKAKAQISATASKGAASRKASSPAGTLASGRDTMAFLNLIWVLGESAYIMLRRAKLEFHSSTPNRISDERWLQSTICCNLGIDLCKHLPPSMIDFEVHSKIKMHSIYAVGLANLGRFFEANRHLNEAQALVSKSGDGRQLDVGIIALRRAEIRLTECYWISKFLPGLDQKDRPQRELNLAIPGFARVEHVQQPQGPQQSQTVSYNYFVLPNDDNGLLEAWFSNKLAPRIADAIASLQRFHPGTTPDIKFAPPRIFECISNARPNPQFVGFETKWRDVAQDNLRMLFSSVLDEAVRSLEIAERNIGGRTQSSLWWSRLRVLQMRVYGLLAHLGNNAENCIIFRKKSADSGIFECFLSATRTAGEDTFRKYRALRYFLEANRWYSHHVGGSNEIKSYAGEFLPDSFDEAKKLLGTLNRSVKKAVPSDLLRIAIEQLELEFPELLL